LFITPKRLLCNLLKKNLHKLKNEVLKICR
jgi:hypothetical protein